ncbi:MAG: strawberry notch-like NTP hydrolase domain-containing protein, partial [Acidobacteriota bacterium]
MLDHLNFSAGLRPPDIDDSNVNNEVATCRTPTDVSCKTAREPTAQPQAYIPHYIVGGVPHPGVIVETPGLANVEPPPITYSPHLPKELCTSGKLSAMQLERIIYAGQAHGQRLADGSRAGISIG